MGRRKHTEEWKHLPVGISLYHKPTKSGYDQFQVVVRNKDKKLVALGYYEFLEDAELCLDCYNRYGISYNNMCGGKMKL